MSCLSEVSRRGRTRGSHPWQWPGSRTPNQRLWSTMRQLPTSGEDEWPWHGTPCQQPSSSPNSLPILDTWGVDTQWTLRLKSAYCRWSMRLAALTSGPFTPKPPQGPRTPPVDSGGSRMGLDAFDPQGFLALLWLSSGSSRSWILQALIESCAWSLGMTPPSEGPGLSRRRSCVGGAFV